MKARRTVSTQRELLLAATEQMRQDSNQLTNVCVTNVFVCGCVCVREDTLTCI